MKTLAPGRSARQGSKSLVDKGERAPVVLLGPGLVARQVRVAPQDVVFVKGLIEASEGLGALFAERGGDLVLAATDSRSSDLDELLADLEAEVGAVVTRSDASDATAALDGSTRAPEKR